MKRLAHALVGLSTIGLLFCFTSAAQPDQANMLSVTSMERTMSNYYFAKANEMTIIVNVVGFVQRPGRYEISTSIDLKRSIYFHWREGAPRKVP